MRDRHHALEFFLAVFQVDGIDDGFALAIRQRQLDRCRIGGINHQRRFYLANQLFIERWDVFFLVAFRALQAYINNLRASAHLPPRNLAGFFPFFFRHQVLEQARADYVGAFADQQRPRAVLRFNCLDAGINCAVRLRRPHTRFLALRHLRNRANVLFRCSAAATY